MTLVLLHGFTGSPRSWDAVLEHLPADAEPLREGVVAPRLAGHGPRPVRVEGFHGEVERLWARVDDVTSGPVHLGGYSMGARVALGMAATRPERVSRMTLIGARDGLADDDARGERRALEATWQERLRAVGVAGFVDYWESLPMWASQAAVPEARRAEQRAERLEHTAEGLCHALDALALAAMPRLEAALREVRAPVTLLTGARDEKFRGLAGELERALPTARRLTVEGAGHNLLLERPERVANELSEDWG